MIGYTRKFKGSRPRDEWEWEEWVFFLLAATRPEVTCAGCTERWNSKEDRGSAGRNGIVGRAEYYGGRTKQEKGDKRAGSDGVGEDEGRRTAAGVVGWPMLLI